MKAAKIVKLNEPLQIQELQTPTPKGTQVLETDKNWLIQFSQMSSDRKYRTMCMMNDIVGNTSYKDLLSPIHTGRTDYYNIEIRSGEKVEAQMLIL
jgi:hypothetical protein